LDESRASPGEHAMNASQDYPHMSEWPRELGPVPTEDQVRQAYAVLDSILKNVKQDDSNYKQDDSSY
jgi:hypothetical protein